MGIHIVEVVLVCDCGCEDNTSCLFKMEAESQQQAIERVGVVVKRPGAAAAYWPDAQEPRISDWAVWSVERLEDFDEEPVEPEEEDDDEEERDDAEDSAAAA